MAYDVHKNLLTSVIVAPPSPATSGTSLVVTAGDGARFAAAVPCNLSVSTSVTSVSLVALASTSEIIRVTAVVGDTLTIIRAQEGTSARTIVAGDLISLDVTAKSLTDIEAGVAASAQRASNLTDLADTEAAKWNLSVQVFTAKAAATSNLALSGLAAVDGFTPSVTGTNGGPDIILATGQTTPSQNGLYAVSAGSWTRPSRFPAGGVIARSCEVTIGGGSSPGTVWVLPVTTPVTIDTTAQAWVLQPVPAGALPASVPLKSTANTFAGQIVLAVPAGATPLQVNLAATQVYVAQVNNSDGSPLFSLAGGTSGSYVYQYSPAGTATGPVIVQRAGDDGGYQFGCDNSGFFLGKSDYPNPTFCADSFYMRNNGFARSATGVVTTSGVATITAPAGTFHQNDAQLQGSPAATRAITGAGIPGGTTIVQGSVNAAGSQATMSANATASATITATIGTAGDPTFTIGTSLSPNDYRCRVYGANITPQTAMGCLQLYVTQSQTGHALSITDGTEKFWIDPSNSNHWKIVVKSDNTVGGIPVLTFTDINALGVGWTIDNLGVMQWSGDANAMLSRVSAGLMNMPGTLDIGNRITFGGDVNCGWLRASNTVVRSLGAVTANGSFIATGSLSHTGTTAGFFGTAAVARPTLSYSRSGAGETAAGAAIRGALATLGLVLDSTTA